MSPATTIEPKAVLMLVVQATALPARVDDREMRGAGVGAALPVAVAARRERGRRADAVRAARGRAPATSSVGSGTAHEVRVAVERGAVGEAELQRLGEQVQVGRRVVLERAQVVGAR